MKIFEFDFYNKYENEDFYISVLAYSELEAIEMLQQNSNTKIYFGNSNVVFKGCINIFELDKTKILL